MRTPNSPSTANCLEFEYPLKNFKGISFALFLIYYIFFSAILLPYLHYHDFNQLLGELTIFMLLSMFYYSVIVFDVPYMIIRRYKRIYIDDIGIKIGSRQLKWEDLGLLKNGNWLSKSYPLISLIPKNGQVPFWSFKIPPKGLTIRGYPFVYNEILPLIKKHRPDIEIASIIDLVMNKRDKIACWHRIILVVAAIIQIGLLLTFVKMISMGASLHFFPMCAIFVFYPSMVCQLNETNIAKESNADILLRNAVLCTGIFTMIFLYIIFIIFPPVWVFFGLLFAEIAILIIVSANAWLCRLNSIFSQLMMLTVLIIIATTSIFFFYTPELPSKNISNLLSKDSTTLIWDTSGRYLAEYCVDGRDKRIIADTFRNTKILIPSHDGGDIIKYMDPSLVIRKIKINDDLDCLYIYDFLSKKERMVDKAGSIKISGIKPISPDKKQLVWLTSNEDGTNIKIQFAELSPSENTLKNGLSFSLPENYAWNQVDWLTEEKVIIKGHHHNTKCENGRNLALFIYNLKTQKFKLKEIDHKATRWYVTSDYKYAFTKSEVANIEIHYVNLGNNKTLKLKGSDLPSWIVDNHFAFRLVTDHRGKVLCRFDLKTGNEIAVSNVPEKWVLNGVSHDGRFALFSPADIFCLASYQLLNIENNKLTSINLSGISWGWVNSSNNGLVLSNPMFSTWSPKGDTTIVESLNFNWLRKEINKKILLMDAKE